MDEEEERQKGRDFRDFVTVEISVDDPDASATVTLPKSRWHILLEGFIFALSNSDMEAAEKLEWTVVLDGILTQANMNGKDNPEEKSD